MNKIKVAHYPKIVPTTEPAKRIATLFRRRLTSGWSEKEVKAFKVLMKNGAFTDSDDLRLVETYYVFNMKKPENYLRRDLLTLLNNWNGEVDRARAWSEEQTERKKRSRPRQQEPQAEVSDQRFGEVRDFIRAEMERFKEQMKNVKSKGFTISSETTLFDDLAKSKIK